MKLLIEQIHTHLNLLVFLILNVIEDLIVSINRFYSDVFHSFLNWSTHIITDGLNNIKLILLFISTPLISGMSNINGWNHNTAIIGKIFWPLSIGIAWKLVSFKQNLLQINWGQNKNIIGLLWCLRSQEQMNKLLLVTRHRQKWKINVLHNNQMLKNVYNAFISMTDNNNLIMIR